MSDTEKTEREFKPKGKPPRHRRKYGWQAGDINSGRILTRTGAWIPLAPEDQPVAEHRRLWISVMLVIMIVLIAAGMRVLG